MECWQEILKMIATQVGDISYALRRLRLLVQDAGSAAASKDENDSGKRDGERDAGRENDLETENKRGGPATGANKNTRLP